MSNELTAEELISRVVDATELNTEKLQELLERVECIDNSLDDIKDNDDIPEILECIKAIVQQGRP